MSDKLFRWISIGSDLKYDARRDLDDVGAKCVEGANLQMHCLFLSHEQNEIAIHSN